MTPVGSNGIYRLYRVIPEDHQKLEFRLVGVFAIVAGSCHIMEDHDGILEDMVPRGKLTGDTLRRLTYLQQSGYWRLVHENDIESGHHADLLPAHKENGE